jgi:(S)-ureidoglycine---glyoxylate transaminase
MPLLAGGGPSSPDPRVLRALTTPLIGQFDPEFTRIMDDVVQLARAAFVTQSTHCFAISTQAPGALEAVLNSVLSEGTTVAIGGSPRFVRETAEMVRRVGGHATDASKAEWVVVPFVDPYTCQAVPVRELVQYVHQQAGRVIVEATLGLGACELQVEDWGIDVCVAGADYAIGAPSGLSLVTYSPEVQQYMQARAKPPTTSYLDLLQLQAYWSPERLNHHTAPTSLVYGLHEALRLAQPVTQSWGRHAQTGQALRNGLSALGLNVTGDLPYSVIGLPPGVDSVLRNDFGVHTTRIAPHAWRIGLLGADACQESVNIVLAALKEALAA